MNALRIVLSAALSLWVAAGGASFGFHVLNATFRAPAGTVPACVDDGPRSCRQDAAPCNIVARNAP